MRAVGPQRELSPVSCCWPAALGAAAGVTPAGVDCLDVNGPMALGCPTVAIGLALADIVIDIEATTYGITLTPQHRMGYGIYVECIGIPTLVPRP